MQGGRAGREGSTLCQMTTVAIARLRRQTRQPAHQAARQARGSPAEFCFAIAQERGALVVKGAVMFRHVIYHEECALRRMPPLPCASFTRAHL